MGNTSWRNETFNLAGAEFGVDARFDLRAAEAPIRLIVTDYTAKDKCLDVVFAEQIRFGCCCAAASHARPAW